jgi:hypothetical protein
MSVGWAIFLSSFVLAVVVLYGITKDRWRWRRIVKRTALTLAAITALTGAVIGGSYIWNQLPAPLASQAEYAGLRLGIGPDEVMYIKGYPPMVLGEVDGEGLWAGQPVISTKDLENGKRAQDYRDWQYEYSTSRLDITFNPEKTAVVAISCYSSDRLKRCPSIVGLSDGDSEQAVIRKLGAPGTARIEGVAKFISYPELAVQLWLSKEQVYMIGVNDRKYQRR